MSKREIWRQAWAYWWIPASVAVVALLVALIIYRTAGQPIGTAPLTDGDTKVIARAPGASFDALTFCQQEPTKVTVSIGPEVVAPIYHATDSRTGEDVRWVEGQPSAEHTWFLANGQPDGETFNVSADVAKCMTEKAQR